MSKLDADLEKHMGIIVRPPSAGEIDATLRDEKRLIPAEPATDERLLGDFDEVRENLMALTRRGQTAVENLLELADQNEDARTYEALSNMLEKLTKVNLSVLEAYERKKKLVHDVTEEKPGGNQTFNQTNNTVIVGTTADMLKKIKEELMTLEHEEHEEQHDDTVPSK